MKNFEILDSYATLVIWDVETGDFLMERDEDFDEYRLPEIPFNENGFAGSLVEAMEEHDLDVESYAKLAEINHVGYTPNNELRGEMEKENVVLVAVAIKEIGTGLKNFDEATFRERIERSSVLPEITKRLILKNC